ncbi:MAG: hypothetical protein P1Q69_16830 [Candidatus Thorarchaeota archaeon]|nr:hypothetical protein [Candidatus Thorarchaeota archaeon]
MTIDHAIELFRANEEVRGAFLLSGLLVFLMMGWLSLAYARLNLYLILISFPLFNAIVIPMISVFLIRAENENLIKLSTIPGGVRKTVITDLTLSIIFVLGLNAFFEILAICLREFLIEAWGQMLPPIDYTPDPLTLFLFIVCNLSFYSCFAGFASWQFSQSTVTAARSGEKLARLEGFVSVKFFLVVALMVVASMLLYLIVQTAVASDQGNAAIEPALVAMLSFAFNAVLSILLLHTAWKAIK